MLRWSIDRAWRATRGFTQALISSAGENYCPHRTGEESSSERLMVYVKPHSSRESQVCGCQVIRPETHHPEDHPLGAFSARRFSDAVIMPQFPPAGL